MERIEQDIDRDYCRAVKAENAKAAKPRKPRLTAAEKRARDWEAAAPARAAREAERLAAAEAQLIRDEERKAVEKRMTDSRMSPRAFHPTPADALADALNVVGSYEWNDLLQPTWALIADDYNEPKEEMVAAAPLVALVEQAQQAMEDRLLLLTGLLTEALELLGERR